ncbi:MAG TPA: DUF4363 family protein [Oscillospiraceae bacterium]|jgi:hypothetical protein|nr:DUF4363 family protein [Oscillospiraceae bacterium]
MKRVKLCCIILIFIIAFSAGMLKLIDMRCDEMLAAVSEIEVLLEKKETARAIEKTDELNLLWGKYYKLLSCLVKHDKLSEINASVAKIKPLIKSENAEVFSELKSLSYRFSLIKDTEFPYWHNIL